MKNRISISCKDIIWNYLGYGFSFGTNILLLPIVLYYLPTEELGLWYIFLSVGAFVAMFDFGFSPQIARVITYSYAGVDEIQKVGVVSTTLDRKDSNTYLLKKVICTAKSIYLVIALLAFILLSTGGTYYIYNVSDGHLSSYILYAWGIFVIASFINILYLYYTAIFRGIGNFVDLNKALALSKLIQIVASVTLLALYRNIMAVTIAYLLSGIMFRFYLSHAFRKKTNVGKEYYESKNNFTIGERYENFKLIWSNAKKDGLVMISRYFVTQSNTVLCSLYLGLTETAGYALSVQILTIVSSISSIYYATQQPLLNAASVEKNHSLKYNIFSKSWVLFIMMYVLFVLIMITIGIPLVNLIKHDTLLDVNMFVFLAIYMFLEANQSLFTSYISTSNYIPYSNAYCVSALLATLLAILLITLTNWGVMGLILAHFIVQLSYNNWRWPRFVLQEFHTSLFTLFKNGVVQLVSQWKTFSFR
ncbi:MAG: O-unit flippase-like protein [Bacteroides nordii]